MARTNTSTNGGGVSLASNGLYLDGATVKFGTNPLIEDTQIDINGKEFLFSGQLANGYNLVQGFSNNIFGTGASGIVNEVTANLSGEEVSYASFVGNIAPLGMTGGAIGKADFITSDTTDRTFGQVILQDDGTGNDSPAYSVFIQNAIGFTGFTMNSEETDFVIGANNNTNRVRLREDRADIQYDFDDGTDIVVSRTENRSGYWQAVSSINDDRIDVRSDVDNGFARTRLQIDGVETIFQTEIGEQYLAIDDQEVYVASKNRFRMNVSHQEKQGTDISLTTANLNIQAIEGNKFFVSVPSPITLDYMNIDGWQNGSTVQIYFASGVTLNNNPVSTPPAGYSKISLAGGTSFTTTSNTIFTFTNFGGSWYETAKTVL